MEMKYILASKSPRRIEYLKKIVENFEVISGDVDENLDSYFDKEELSNLLIECPYEIPMFLSNLKCETVAKDNKNAVVLGADTVVYFEGKLIGKATSDGDAKRILKSLSGQTHTVYTGFTVCYKERVITDYDESVVTFNELSDELIDSYVASGLAKGKAGAYGIQDGYPLASKVVGEIDNVLGFPTKKILKAINAIIKG